MDLNKISSAIDSAKKFRVQFGDIFDLADAADELLSLARQSDALKSQGEAAAKDLAAAKAGILVAQSQVEAIRAQGKQDADDLIAQAHSQAQSVLSDAQQKADSICQSALSEKEKAISEKAQVEGELKSTQDARDAAKAELDDLNTRIDAARKAAAAAFGA